MNTQEVDRIIASQLRDTYRDTFNAADYSRSDHTPFLVMEFCANAYSADDYTLCELEAIYHASRAV